MPPLGNNNSHLLLLTVKQTTKNAYLSALRCFLLWIKTNHSRQTLTKIHNAADLDPFLNDYIHYLFFQSDSRGNRQRAINARCAIIMLDPAGRDQLHKSSRALKGWDRHKSAQQHAPMPGELAFCLIWSFLRDGMIEHALILWLAFDAYLRITEVLSLCRGQCIRNGNVIAISLPVSKTGRNQAVLLQCCALVELLHQYKDKVTRNKMFAINRNHFQRAVATRLQGLGLGDIHLTPHSLRHGGAVHDFISGTRTLQEIILRGRWRHQKSAENYLQTARALYLTTKIPPEVVSKGRRFLQNPELMLRTLV